ncbi:MAG: hypothetical protein U0R69_06525 [Gaiellales bacterium]
MVGGHAIVACGYDDALQIKNAAPGSPTTKGAFRIRNSWGTSWGVAGWGWIPYEYVLAGLAVDWWSLLDLPRHHQRRPVLDMNAKLDDSPARVQDPLRRPAPGVTSTASEPTYTERSDTLTPGVG